MVTPRAEHALTERDFNPATLRGVPGCFRAGRTHGGHWWPLDPDGRPVFLRAVAAVDPADDAELTTRRLRTWGFNTLGPGGRPGALDDGFSSTANAGFRDAGGPVIRGTGVHLPDVFDPGWIALCERRASEVVPSARDRRGLVGWYTDDGLAWGGARGRPSLLQICLGLEPGFAAYHAAWEFVLAANAADPDGPSGVDPANRGAVRQLTLEDRVLDGPGFRRDAEGFAREFAHRYFSATSGALRRHDPRHLVLGCRFAAPPGAAVLAVARYPLVDVVSCQMHDLHLDPTLAGSAPEDMPVLVTDLGLTNEQFHAEPLRVGVGPTRLERMLRAGRRALTDASVHPAVVGYEWGRWADGPADTPPFGGGLVRADGREAVEHTELVARANLLAETRRRHACAG